MGILGKLRRKNNDDDDDDDDFGLEDGIEAGASDPDDLDDDDDDDTPSGGGLFGRLKSKLTRSGRQGDDDGEDEDDDDGIFLSGTEALSKLGGPEAVPVTVTDGPAVASSESGGGGSGGGDAPDAGGSPVTPPTPVYIVDGPEGQPAPESGEAAPKEEPSGAGPGTAGGIGLDLKDIFEDDQEVDEVLKDLADSMENVSAADLARDLRELMDYLKK